MDGIFIINKESGWTSFDVVAKMRGILQMKKIGHTGTLDPAATGVLPVCVGKATKLVEKVAGEDKEYLAVMLLGEVTDTQDKTGEVIKKQDVNATEDEVIGAIKSFIGGYDQLPPMYSAKKVNGKKLVDLARKGVEVERKPRFVNIIDIRIEEVALPRVRMRVTCGKGTYIRTLCNDIGEKLGCGGCMESLVRTRVGEYTLDKAITLGELEAFSQENRLEEVVINC